MVLNALLTALLICLFNQIFPVSFFSPCLTAASCILLISLSSNLLTIYAAQKYMLIPSSAPQLPNCSKPKNYFFSRIFPVDEFSFPYICESEVLVSRFIMKFGSTMRYASRSESEKSNTATDGCRTTGNRETEGRNFQHFWEFLKIIEFFIYREIAKRFSDS